MANTRVGIQFIVFRGREQGDLDGVLRDCVSAGYQCVESGFPFECYSPSQVKELCQKYRLEFAGGHTGYEAIADTNALLRIAEDVKTAGGKYLLCSGVAPGKNVKAYQESAKAFNAAGRLARDTGLTFCYHNHNFEFEEVNGGTTGMQVLATETAPELVKFNIDMAWVQIAGQSPSDFIERHRDRAGYYHVKDAFIKGRSDIAWTELGKGDIEVEAACRKALALGADYFIYEQDVASIPIKQAISDSRQFFSKLGL